MNHFRQIAATTALSLLLPALTFAQATGPRQLADWETPGDREVTRLPMYQSFHPDHRWRQQGLRAQAAGQYASTRSSRRCATNCAIGWTTTRRRALTRYAVACSPNLAMQWPSRAWKS